MFVAGIAHHYVFSHNPYVQEGRKISWYSSFKALLDFSDLKQDVAEQIRHVGKYSHLILPDKWVVLFLPQWPFISY